MGKTAAIKIEIDGGASVKEIQSIEEGLTAMEKSLRNLSKGNALEGAEKSFKELNSVVEENALSVQDMTKAMENYVNIAATAGRKSPIGKEALKRAGAMKDQIDGLSNEVSQLAKDGQNLQSALQLGTGVVAGYQAFQSVTALVGEENEELMEIMVKLQAAQGLLMSVEQIRMTLEKESVLVTKANAFWTAAQTKAVNIQSNAKKKDIVVTGIATAAQWLWNKAILANPIVAIAAAVIALTGGIIALSSAYGDNADKIDKAKIQQEAWNKATKEAAEATVDQKVKLQTLIEVAKDEEASLVAREQALKKAKEQGGKYLEGLTLQNIATDEGARLINTYVDALNKKAEAEAIQATLVEAHKEIVELRTKELEIDLNQMSTVSAWQDAEKEKRRLMELAVIERNKEIDAIQQKADAIADMLKPMEAERLELEAGEEAAKKEAKAKDEAEKKKTAAAKRGSENRKKNAEREREDAQKAAEEKAANEIAAQMFLDSLMIDILKEGEEKATLQRQAAFENQISQLEKNGQLTIEIEKQLLLQLESDLSAIREEAALAVMEKEVQREKNRAKAVFDAKAESMAKALEAQKIAFELENELLEEQAVLDDDLKAERLIRQEEKLNEIKRTWGEKNQAEAKARNAELVADELESLDKMAKGVEKLATISNSITEIQLNKAGDDEKKKEEIRKKSFKRDKALNISMALIAGAQSALQGIAKFGPPPSPGGIAAIASAAAITSLQVAAIASAKYDGGGGSVPAASASGVSSGGSGGNSGNANDDTITDTAPLISDEDPVNPKATKVFVSAVDISNVQATSEKIDTIGTLD